MWVLGDGRLYLEAGEKPPFVCPECEHIMEWRASSTMIVCEKCDYAGMAADFSKTLWRMATIN